MFATQFYYQFKRYLPSRLRWSLRRLHARRVLRRSRQRWPIDPAAGTPPNDWPGWPEGKKFAFVLTHDVESVLGLDRVRPLAELEMALGFRSSFNFVPEGGYKASPILRSWLGQRGFEVGVHDLHHDGKLCRSRRAFRQKAARIQQYLERWDAAGFRSGFMLNQLDWFHDLALRYDASTFDTDPFEPQPEGVQTIFPFWVQRRDSSGPNERNGYLELPYTLPQDSTLFLLLGQTSPEIWLRKLDWIAEHGGMALVIVHPDYLRFPNEVVRPRTFPVAHYETLLRYAQEKYSDQIWHALPSQVTDFMEKHRRLSLPRPRRKIWIDLDNTPHVPFFQPIIQQLRQRGYDVVLTARDAFQVCELADQAGLDYEKIGRHYGRNRFLKIAGLLRRSLQLLPFVRRERPDLALSHGSRAQLFLCNLRRIPTIMINDYEHARTPPLIRPRWEIVPEVLCRESLHCRRRDRIRAYRGIKEDVYAPGFRPDPALRAQLGLNGEVVVTVRPPATEAHYHNPESEAFFQRFMERVARTPGVKAVLLPRNKNQERAIRRAAPDWFRDQHVIVPPQAVNGLNLLWHSDLVVSGGGTMNREAAALRVPVYSIFRGKTGTVDRNLQKEGRLVLIEKLDDIETLIALKHRAKEAPRTRQDSEALSDIVRHIEEIARLEK